MRVAEGPQRQLYFRVQQCGHYRSRSRNSEHATRNSAFAAFFPYCQLARVPLVIFRMRRTKPAVTRIAERCGRLVARLIKVGNGFTRRFYFWAGLLAG